MRQEEEEARQVCRTLAVGAESFWQGAAAGAGLLSDAASSDRSGHPGQICFPA